MTVLYCYRRYYAPYEEKLETVDAALIRASNDTEEGQAYPVKIVLEDGTELDHEEIMERIER